jgi:hypothetical protein
MTSILSSIRATALVASCWEGTSRASHLGPG